MLNKIELLEAIDEYIELLKRIEELQNKEEPSEVEQLELENKKLAAHRPALAIARTVNELDFNYYNIGELKKIKGAISPGYEVFNDRYNEKTKKLLQLVGVEQHVNKHTIELLDVYLRFAGRLSN